MPEPRESLKNFIRDEILNQSTEGARAGYVSAVVGNGQVSVLVGGQLLNADNPYNAIPGQQVVVVSSGGVVKAYPTRPGVPLSIFQQSVQYQTLLGAARGAAQCILNTGPFNNNLGLIIQDLGNSDVFVIDTGLSSGQFGEVVYTKLSPNGNWIAIAFQKLSAPFDYRFRSYKIGPSPIVKDGTYNGPEKIYYAKNTAGQSFSWAQDVPTGFWKVLDLQVDNEGNIYFASWLSNSASTLACLALVGVQDNSGVAPPTPGSSSISQSISSGGSSVTLHISISAPAPGWINTPDTFQTPNWLSTVKISSTQLDVTIDPTGAGLTTPGIYFGWIALQTLTNGTPSWISITLTIPGGATDPLTFDTNFAIYSIPHLGSPASDTVNLTVTAPFAGFTASTHNSQAGLTPSVSPSSGSGNTALTFTINVGTLAAGFYAPGTSHTGAYLQASATTTNGGLFKNGTKVADYSTDAYSMEMVVDSTLSRISAGRHSDSHGVVLGDGVTLVFDSSHLWQGSADNPPDSNVWSHAAYTPATLTKEYSAQNFSTSTGADIFCLREDRSDNSFKVFSFTNPVTDLLKNLAYYVAGLTILHKDLSKCFFASPQKDAGTGYHFYFYYPISAIDEGAKTITVDTSHPVVVSPGASNPHVFRISDPNEITDPQLVAFDVEAISA